MEGLNPLGGRFQTLHSFCIQNATVDMKGSTGDQLTFVVLHDKIELMLFGFEVMAAGGAMTVAGQLRLDKIPLNNGTRVNGVNANATVTWAGATASIYSKVTSDLNLYATAVSPSPVAGPESRPTAVRGDVLIVNLITQGTGAGAQTARPFILYRERPLT